MIQGGAPKILPMIYSPARACAFLNGGQRRLDTIDVHCAQSIIMGRHDLGRTADGQKVEWGMSGGTHAGPSGLRREIVLDIFHLSLGFGRETPAGVDRVDAVFAAHFLSADVPNRKALLLTPRGPRAVRIAAARDIFEGVQTHWRETQRPEADTAFSRVRDALAGLLTPRPHSLSKTALSGRVKEAFRVGIRAAILHAAHGGRSSRLAPVPSI